MDNIEYSYLVQDSHIDREQLDEIVDLIVDTVCSARKVIRIAGDDYPAEVVKSRFLKLDSSHVQYVMDCMKDIQVTFNTLLLIEPDAALRVVPGAIVVNASRIIVNGSIVNEGSFKNNSVVEKRSGGSFVGTMDGEGVLAYSIIVLPSKEGRVDVMAESDDAVVLRAEDGDLFFNTASIYLKSSNSKIVLTAPSSMYIGGESFTVGLKKIHTTADTQTWSLFFSGFDVGSSISIDVMIPLRLADGFTAKISGPDGSEAEVLSIQDGVLSFRANGSGDYLISAVMAEDPGEGSLLSGMSLNIIVAALITIVAAIVVYLLLRDV